MSKLKASYDRDADVLYLNLGPPVPVEGDGRPRGVELDYAVASGDPCGLTVIGYVRNGWDKMVSELADIASMHLSVPPAKAEGTITRAVRS